MSTPIEPKELGTLIVVVGKARNLPNKSRFGKQDPFCTVIVGEEKQKTKPIKRGGQHPEWDEEFRFAILEDVEDVVQRSESQSESLNSSLNGKPLPVPDDPGVITTAALASKSRKIKKKGGKSMKVACFADDAKEPELIGDCVVSLEDVLKKGEVDDWYDFQYKEKYSGEIYLELTFFSNEAPPVKRNVPRPSIPRYGPPSLNGSNSSMSFGSTAGKGALPQLSSGSISGANLYIPPYAPQAARVPSPASQPGQSTSFADLGLPSGHRKSSPLPPIQQAQHGYQPSFSSSLSVNSRASVDVLTRPMSSMSLNPSVNSFSMSSAPAPSAPSSSYGHSHRHSFGGSSEAPWGSVLPHSGYAPAPTPHLRPISTQSIGAGSEAPWGSMLPQSHPAPAPTPHPRPMSTNDALTGEQTMRMEADRLRTAATPMLRPSSGMSHGAAPASLAPPVAPISAPSPQDSRITSTIPESLRPAGPPQPHQHYSQPPPPFTSNQYHGQPPTPAPPLHSHSAGSISPVATTLGHYQVPSSSFSGLAQPPGDSRRASSPGPGYYAQQSAGQFQPQCQVNGAYGSPVGGNGYGQREGYSTPTRSNIYPVPPAQDHQQSPPSSQGYYPPQPPQTPQSYPPQSSPTPQPYYQTLPPAHQQQPPLPPAPPQSYAYSQSSVLPHRQPSPVPPPPQPQTNESGYVPWYQQTQSAQPQPQSHTPYPQSHTPQPQSHTPLPQSHTPLPQSHTPLPQSHTPLPQSHTPQPQSYPYAQQPYGQQPQHQDQQAYHLLPPAPQYSQPLPPPPPVPERRPQPQAPAPPPSRPSFGYYPSDELYLQRQEGRDPYGR
ncbi:hypothetical protein CNBG3160 [Cryptococcus deneoformans B-3501A]|uniref:hypothetical protein n=1 Tax=Cryptococcus deneoformans (strain B-3501A) TaxID=283643 RepID=UPI000042EF99|nr:hypothetical protein CNBG3160 [Cryptococcus neoformans var. neoformans B-3501A]EAL19688.1 hypothetical protein CNBG3160 [Cryptococcus neoformans var. neoformans B-3501A]